jgi:hypothetical protein
VPGEQFGDLFFRIIQVPKNSGFRRTNLYAGRVESCINPVIAEVTLLDDRHEGIDIPGVVRTGGKTIFASDTPVFIDDDDSVLLFPGGLDRTIDDAGRMVALIAERGKKMACDVRVSSLFDDLHPRAIDP